jgi:acetylornithine deacetylase
MMDEGQRERILGEVEARRGEIVLFLQDLIRIPSLPGEEGRGQAFIEQKLRTMGMDIDVWEPDLGELRKDPWFMNYPLLERVGYYGRPVLVGVYKGAGGGRSLMLQGHIDVVPVGDRPWKYGPWSGTIDGDRLYGRGSSDMKSGMAAMIMAFDCVQSAGIRLKGDVIIESVIDEELGGNGALACVQRGYKADAAIIPEPTGCHITAACEGVLWVKVKIEGKAAHPAAKHQGVCAIEKGMKVYQAIKDLEASREQKVSHPAFDKTEYPSIVPIVVGMFRAGVHRSTVADEANLVCRVGFLPGENPERVYREFCDKIRETAEGDPWMRDHLPMVEMIGIPVGASEIPMDHPIIESLKRCQKLVTGREPKVNGIPMGSEQRILIERAKTPCAVFGPGNPGTAHMTDECLEPIEDLIVATKTLALTLADWCGTEST